MRSRSVAWAARVAVWGAWLLCACLGCARLVAPLDQPLGRAAPEPESTLVLLRVATCWAALPLAEDLAAAYALADPSTSLELLPSSPRVAEDLLLAGQADIALVARGLPSDEAPEGLRSTTLAQSAVGVAVYRDSLLRRLTTSELATLFAGRILDWSELQAGRGRVEIVIQNREAVARTLFDARIMGEQAVSSAAIVMPHDRGVLEYVAQRPGAVGYVALPYADERVRLVALDDTVPSLAEIKRQRYPLTFALVALTPVEASHEAARLVAFAVSRGQRAIEQRHVPAH